MKLLSKIWNGRFFFFSLPITIYFNFRNFPLKQAVKLPVWLYRPKIFGKGEYRIEGPVSTGMIRFGFPMVSVFREKGAVLENKGKVIFKGETLLGGGSGIAVGENGTLVFGDKFCNQTGGKIICYHNVNFGKKVRIGWNSIVCDTDFHSMKSEDGSSYTKGYGPITIGDEVWVGSYCKIYKNTVIPTRCTVASGMTLTKKLECRPYSLIYPGGGVKIKYTGLYRDMEDDKIDYKKD